MNEIIQFKPRKKSSLGEALYEKLEGGWKILQIASPKSLPYFRLNAAGRDGFRDLFDFAGHSVIALFDPQERIAAGFAVDLEESWVAEIIFFQQVDGLPTLQALAKLFQAKGWCKSFKWKQGYVFSTDGTVHYVHALPSTIEVAGDAVIEDMTEVTLPEYFMAKRRIQINNSTIKRPPRRIYCRDLVFNGSKATHIADLLVLNGSLQITVCDLESICQTGFIDQDIYIEAVTNSVRLPENLTVRGNLEIKDALVLYGGFNNVICGSIIESYRHTKKGCFGTDHVGRLLTNGTKVRLLLPRPRHGLSGYTYTGFFQERNEDNEYTCLFHDSGHRKQLKLLRLELLAMEGPEQT